MLVDRFSRRRFLGGGVLFVSHRFSSFPYLEIKEKIQVALSFGDLSENSEYDEARNDQGKLEARIS
ncbi:MAG: hypothetical protein K6A33_03775, partial [Clostridiales bacterium]|nr:hypothetical protein [Clostridiales bacterium]